MSTAAPGAAVTVFSNAACSKCRTLLGLLGARGTEYGLVEYLVAPPDRAELDALVAKLDGPAADLVRTSDPAFGALGLDPGDYTTAVEVAALLAEHPELMQRPVVVRGDRAIIARPPERVAELLDDARSGPLG